MGPNSKNTKPMSLGPTWFWVVPAVLAIVLAGSWQWKVFADPSSNPPGISNPSRTDVERLEGQGYALSDIRSAYSIAAATGTKVDDLLSQHKSGKSWDDIAQGIHLTPPSNVAKPSGPDDKGPLGITAKQFKDLVDQGNSPQDVAKAAAIARDLGVSLSDVLSTLHSSGSWGQALPALLAQAGRSKGCQNGDCKVLLGSDGKGTQTASGLSRTDIAALEDKGYTIEDIMTADSIAAANGMKAVDVLSLKANGQDWPSVLSQVSTEKGGLKGSPGSNSGQHGQAPNTVPGSGLSDQDVASLLVKGYSHADIARAAQMGSFYGASAATVLDQFTSAGKDWAKTGEQLALAARQQGRTFAAPNNTSPGKGLTVDVLAQQFGVSSQMINNLISQGFTLPDIRQALVIARVSGVDVSKVLAAKTPSADWVDVAKSFKPNPQQGGN